MKNQLSSNSIQATLLTILAIAGYFALYVSLQPIYANLFLGFLFTGFFLFGIIAQQFWVGIALIAAVALLQEIQKVPSLPGASIVKALMVILVLAFGFKMLTKKDELQLPSTGKAILIFWVTLIPTVILNPVGITTWVSVGGYFFIYFSLSNEIKNTQQVKNILRAIVIVSGLVGLFALFQFIFKSTFLPSRSIVGDALLFEQGYSSRVVGTANDPNAGALVPLLALPLIWPLYSSEKSTWWRSSYILAGILMFQHILLSQSRSSWIGLTIAVLCQAIWFRRVRFIRLAVLTFAVLSGLNYFSGYLPIGEILDRAAIIFSASDLAENEVGRIIIYSGGLKIFFDHWIVGVGFSNFRNFLFQYVGHNQTAHNNLLAIGAEAGIFALLAYLSIFFSLIRKIKQQNDNLSGQNRMLVIGLACSLIAWQIQGMFNAFWVWSVGWLILALADSVIELNEKAS